MKQIRNILLVVGLAMFGLMSGVVSAATITVHSGEVASVGNGKCSLQEAITLVNYASPQADCIFSGTLGVNDVIRVMPGTYRVGDLDSTTIFGSEFIVEGTALKVVPDGSLKILGFGNPEDVIIDAEGKKRVFVVHSASGQTVRLENLTITGGRLNSDHKNQTGAGIYAVPAVADSIKNLPRFEFKNVRIVDNLIDLDATEGGAATAAGLSISGTQPFTAEIVDSFIARNRILLRGKGDQGFGGGIYLSGGVTDIVRTSIANNILGSVDGAEFVGGAGIAMHYGDAVTIGSGSGLGIFSDPIVNFRESAIFGNYAVIDTKDSELSNSYLAIGGGVSAITYNLKAENTIFAYNEAQVFHSEAQLDELETYYEAIAAGSIQSEDEEAPNYVETLGNAGSAGGGIFYWNNTTGNFDSGVDLDFNTFIRNGADKGAAFISMGDNKFELLANLIADNINEDGRGSCGEMTFVSEGYNIFDEDCGNWGARLSGNTPDLLTDLSVGTTYTTESILLEPNTALGYRDYVPEALCSVSIDQRGISRPYASKCDVGSYEWWVPPIKSGLISPDDVKPILDLSKPIEPVPQFRFQLQ